MSSQLPADCLNEIFEYLDNKVTLRSCLSVNRIWCKCSVRILWRTTQNYNTLFACLPSESKERLHDNEIILSTPSSKHPLFNYVAFIKSFPIDKTVYMIRCTLMVIRSIWWIKRFLKCSWIGLVWRNWSPVMVQPPSQINQPTILGQHNV